MSRIKQAKDVSRAGSHVKQTKQAVGISRAQSYETKPLRGIDVMWSRPTVEQG